MERDGVDISIAHVWSEAAPRLYAQTLAGQWDPATAVDWDAPCDHPAVVEDAVVQVMTYLAENEQAALLVPTRFMNRVHPHYREVLQFMAVQAADEARHMEVFIRRALLHRDVFGTSTTGGRASLQSLFTETEMTTSSLLLSVLSEGNFLHLLAFLERYAPDPVTRRVCHLALTDEARHVAFGLSPIRRNAIPPFSAASPAR